MSFSPDAARNRRPTGSAIPRSSARWNSALLAVVLVLGAVLRFLHLGEKSFWMDEGVSFTINHLSWIDFVKISWRRELNMAPYYLVLRLWMKFGTSEAFLRSLSVIFSLAAIVAIYFLARLLFGTRAAQFAAVLAAVHAFLIRYAQEARSYSLAIFLVTLSCFFFVRKVQQPGAKGSTGYILASALAVYSHFFSLLVILAQWLALQFLPKESPARRKFHRAWKILALAILPLIVFIASRGAGPIAWITRPSLSSLHEFFLFLSGNGGNALLIAYAILALIALGVPIVQRVQLPSFEIWGILFAFSWLIVPIVVTLIFSLARPVFLPRYLVICVPALLLIASAALGRLRNPWLQVGVLLLLIGFSLRGVQSYYRSDFDLSREDWRAATAYILSHTEKGDGVVFHAALGRMPFTYYAARGSTSRPEPEVAFPNSGPIISYTDFVANAKKAPIDTIATVHSRIWLVLAHNKLAGKRLDDVTVKLEEALARQFPCMEQKQFPEIQVLLYSRTCPGASRP
jgi:mannosyltransferase